MLGKQRLPCRTRPAAPAPGRGACLVLLGALCFSTSGTAQALAPEVPRRPTSSAPCACRWPFWPCCANACCSSCITGPCAGCCRPRAGGAFPALLFSRGPVHRGRRGHRGVHRLFPLATAVQAWLLLGERPCPRWYASTLLSRACLCCLSGTDGTVAWTSLCCPWPPARTYALYFVCTRPLGRQYAPDSIMLVLTGLSGLALLPVLLASPLYWLACPAGTVTAFYLGTVTAVLACSLTTTGLSAPAPRRHIGHAGPCRAAGRCLPGHFSSA